MTSFVCEANRPVANFKTVSKSGLDIGRPSDKTFEKEKLPKSSPLQHHRCWTRGKHVMMRNVGQRGNSHAAPA